MDRREVDVAVIGAGTAGLNARKEVEKAGKRWALIESGPYGTTCARVGCMPSKLLIAAADAAAAVKRAPVFGVLAEATLDGRAVMRRVREERDRFTGFVVRSTEELPAEQRITGRARFVAPNRLRIDDHTEVAARAVVIATGSRPFVPESLASIRDRLLLSDDVFELEDLPASLAVFGTGIIALELGQAFARLGVRVAFFNPNEAVGMLTDPELVAQTRTIFAEELELHLGVEATVTPSGSRGATLRWRDERGERREDFEAVLVAAGRRPNVEALDLDRAGLELAEGVPVHDERTMQCGRSAVFLAGDVCGHRPLLHEAADEGRIAGANAARFPAIEASERRISITVAFTDPQLAIAGAPHRDLGAIEFGEASYDDQGRARVMAENRGRLRVYGEPGSCRLVGAEMIGPRMEHVAHLLAWSIATEMTVEEALRMPFYHPTLEEGLRTALRDLARKLRVIERCRPEDLAEGPGA
jgi:dihydrolipoamide dehydrogenase